MYASVTDSNIGKEVVAELFANSSMRIKKYSSMGLNKISASVRRNIQIILFRRNKALRELTYEFS